MKKLIFFACLLAILSFKTHTKMKVVFFGDSITQMGVNNGGYIQLIQSHLKSKGWQNEYEVVGAGIGGNKVYDLYLRMEEDVLSQNPTHVVVYVGINDVWHKSSLGTGTDIDKYEKFYTAIIKKLQAKNINVLVCTPTVIGEKWNNTNPQDGDLNAYSDVIRKLAAKENCTLIDLRKTFLQYETEKNTMNQESGILTTDRVHLNATGNQLLADEMMKALKIK